jgi:hypothetical protein
MARERVKRIFWSYGLRNDVPIQDVVKEKTLGLTEVRKGLRQGKTVFLSREKTLFRRPRHPIKRKETKKARDREYEATV